MSGAKGLDHAQAKERTNAFNLIEQLQCVDDDNRKATAFTT
jgi:hypothetical protein